MYRLAVWQATSCVYSLLMRANKLKTAVQGSLACLAPPFFMYMYNVHVLNHVCVNFVTQSMYRISTLLVTTNSRTVRMRVMIDATRTSPTTTNRHDSLKRWRRLNRPSSPRQRGALGGQFRVPCPPNPPPSLPAPCSHRRQRRQRRALTARVSVCVCVCVDELGTTCMHNSSIIGSTANKCSNNCVQT